MGDSAIYPHESMARRESASPNTYIELLGLPLNEALKMLDGDAFAVEYTRAPRFASNAGRPRVVRVKDGVITAALFSDKLLEDTDEQTQ